jgi:hypothetical protein
MSNPSLYKKETLTNVKNRNTSSLNTDEKTRVNVIVNKFFELFKNKHM